MKLRCLSLLYLSASLALTNNVHLDKRSPDSSEAAAVVAAAAAAPQPDSDDTSSENIELPPTMGKEEFDAVTSQKLTLVEFYSPYCLHCKSFFPTWKKAYLTFRSKFANSNTDMRQVNCVENGDLCEREQIEFYPNILLYAPILDKDGNLQVNQKILAHSQEHWRRMKPT